MAIPMWLAEQWIEYAIGVFIILLRIYTRVKIVGVRGWKGDDYIILVALFWYTVTMVMHQYLSYYPTNVGISNEKAKTLTEKQIRLAVTGSKYNFVSWISYSNLIWSLKCCMLFFYQRLTMGLWQRKVVVVGWWMLGISYIGVWCSLLFHCWPISLNWAVKPHPKCVPAMPNFYVIGALNIVTDAVLLCIPFPILKKARIPLRRKLIIGLLLFSGIFIIIATTLNNVLSIIYILSKGKLQFSPGFVTGWSARENFVAVLVVNLPCIKPLFSSSTWIKSTTRSNTRGTNGFSSSGNVPPISYPSRSKSGKEAELDIESYGLDDALAQTPSPSTTVSFSNKQQLNAWPEGIRTTVSFDVSQQQAPWSAIDSNRPKTNASPARRVDVTIEGGQGHAKAHGGVTAQRI